MIKFAGTITSVMILMFLLFGPNSLCAGDTGKIAGLVMDKTTDEPLAGANIIVSALWVDDKEVPLTNPTGASTDADGEYYILNLRPGLYTVQAVFVGYIQENITKVGVTIDKTTRLDFALAPEVLEGEEITVTAYRSEEVEIDLTATKQVYNANEVLSIAGVADINDILELQADVVDDHFRGGRLGESTYLLGGGVIVNPLNNRRAFSPIVTGLEQVEVYTSGFSAEYGNAQSGVVNMVPKEGTPTWISRMEMSSTLPYYKTWQGSPYDEDNAYYYSLLRNTEEWLKENPTNPGLPLFDAGYGFGPSYLPTRIVWPPVFYTHDDSLKIAELGQILFLQSVRDLGMEYDNTMDYRLDFSTGGPLTDKSNIFLAARQNVVHPIVPTSTPDISRQMIVNLVNKPTNSDKIKLGYIYDDQFENDLVDWRRYLFERTLNVTKINDISQQYSIDWQHVQSQSTIFDMKISLLDLLQKERVDLVEAGDLLDDYRTKTNWTDYTSPAFYRVGRPDDDLINQRSQTWSLNASMTSQVNYNNLIKSGLQFIYYDINVNSQINMTNEGSLREQKFTATPYEGALYVQDKMEFAGLIAQLGLRYDFYQLDTDYFENPFAPLESKVPTKFYSHVQPRIGISFPVSTTSVFHLNYGTFTQRPNFNQLFFNQYTTGEARSIEVLGNPNLKPENTKAYDIGVVQGLPFGFKLDVSAYYKDVKDLVETAYYTNRQQAVYRTYINRDYADIKGFHLSFEHNEGLIRGYVRYNYESATGKSSNDLDAPVTYFENPDPKYGSVRLPDPEDIYLDYDRSHKTLINLRIITPGKWGYKLLDAYPLGNFSISTTFRISTGRPYTWDATGQGLKMNQRTPDERELRIRIQKKLSFSAAKVTVYAEGFNLLNEKIYQYSRTFNDERETGRWQYDRENILTYNEYEPYVSSQAIYLLSNEPRHFRMGLIFDF